MSFRGITSLENKKSNYMKREINHNQDLKIKELEITLKNLIMRVDKFIENDFHELKRLVGWLVGLAISGILIPIFLKLLF